MYDIRFYHDLPIKPTNRIFGVSINLWGLVCEFSKSSQKIECFSYVGQLHSSKRKQVMTTIVVRIVGKSFLPMIQRYPFSFSRKMLENRAFGKLEIVRNLADFHDFRNLKSRFWRQIRRIALANNSHDIGRRSVLNSENSEKSQFLGQIL